MTFKKITIVINQLAKKYAERTCDLSVGLAWGLPAETDPVRFVFNSDGGYITRSSRWG